MVKKSQKSVTKEKRLKASNRVILDGNVQSVNDLIDSNSIDIVMDHIEQWKVAGKLVKDGTKYYYVLYVIHFLEYLLDCCNSSFHNEEVKNAIRKWKKIKDDLNSGMMKERSEKKKRDVDSFEQGEMVGLLDCYNSNVELFKDVKNINFTEEYDESNLKTFYCYCITSLCLKSLIRPSAICQKEPLQ